MSVLALVIVGILATLAYAWIAVDTATSVQEQNALNRNFAAARIGARLLNEQWADLIIVIKELTQHSSIEPDIVHHNQAGLQHELKYAVDLVPALMLAAVYDRSGTRICSYPESSVSPASASDRLWFKEVSRRHALYQSDSFRIKLPDQPVTEVINVVLPIGQPESPSGYMLILYRVGDVNRWLTELGMQDSNLYIINDRGKVVDASAGANRSLSFIGLQSFISAREGKTGSKISHKMYQNEPAAVGYAFAGGPGWAVLVSQRVSRALAPTRSRILRLTVLGAMVLALLAVSAIIIVRLYRVQHQMSLTLANQNEQLRYSDKIKSDFLANVSHDLRTPVTSMQISISSLLDPELPWDNVAARESLKLASDSVEQISSRVRNLLEMARIEAHAWPQTQQVCDLTDLVASSLENMRALTVGRELCLTFPKAPLLLECDPTQIETVLVNLLENALKYTPEGTRLQLDGSIDGDYLLLQCIDDGPGIPEEEIPRIFDKFYRSQAQITVGGTGLGLAICLSIIQAHGGTIGMRNRRIEGRVCGAEFWFKLPALVDTYTGDSNE